MHVTRMGNDIDFQEQVTACVHTVHAAEWTWTELLDLHMELWFKHIGRHVDFRVVQTHVRSRSAHVVANHVTLEQYHCLALRDPDLHEWITFQKMWETYISCLVPESDMQHYPKKSFQNYILGFFQGTLAHKNLAWMKAPVAANVQQIALTMPSSRACTLCDTTSEGRPCSCRRIPKFGQRPSWFWYNTNGMPRPRCCLRATNVNRTLLTNICWPWLTLS